MLTPQKIENRLYDLSKEVDETNEELIKGEKEYHTSKAALEISMAKSRLKNSHPDLKMTVQMRDDQALVDNEDLYMRVAVAEVSVKAARANVQKVRTQVDIARSIGTSVRTSMEVA